MLAGRIHAYLTAQGYPVTEVTVGKDEDRATWRASYAAGTAEATVAAADAAIASVTTAQLDAAAVDAEASADSARRATKATIELVLRRTTAGWATMTAAQRQTARDAIRDEWLTIYKALAP